MKYNLVRFEVKNYRSLLNVGFDISNSAPVILCGENNIGKTNVLEAFNLFFNHISDSSVNHYPPNDIPHHITYGSGGAGNFTNLAATFDTEKGKCKAEVRFDKKGQITYKVTYDKSTPITSEAIFKSIVDTFDYIFIRSNNINMPKIVSHLFSSEGLLKLDSKRGKQSKPLETLRTFQEEAQHALNDIEKELNIEMEKIVSNDFYERAPRIKISFAEFNKLRDAVANMTEITLDDGNDLHIGSKGSGAQRLVLLSLMKYIGKNTDKNVIWALDEPEVFLQPRLQKKLFKSLKQHSQQSNEQTILTTHSQHFVDLTDLSNTHLFKLTYEDKIYERKKHQSFVKKDTKPVVFSSPTHKAKKIMEHLGIESGDSWSIFPHNILVEGETDKRYLEYLLDSGLDTGANIISAGSANKMASYLRYYDQSSEDLTFTPVFIVVLDYDDAGRLEQAAISKVKYKNIKVEALFYPRSDGKKAGKANKNLAWCVEDFLPLEMLFDGMNKVLKRKGYKTITLQYQRDRFKTAYQHQPILDYCQTICTHRNSEKTPLSIKDDGLKMFLCTEILKCCDDKDYSMDDIHIQFLQQLVEEN
ncbi:ATP-dependent nuclease [Vibrio splendidus]|uniref:ATP-dependent nuclease n=1 Tax=Vibrio splendidus TaxID=29497 RepID=UPI0000671B1D|nr:AAA family ATPase [Vibrio splendidus]EAP93099.1 putative ATP/GTP-binding protein [Vibrio splendidus 12B01]